jgi:hypothetical protein
VIPAQPIRSTRGRAARRGASLLVAAFMAATVGAPLVAAASPGDLFISEYLEGSGNNKALELYNGTGAPVDLGGGSYFLDFYANGSNSVTASIALSGTIANGDVYVIANPLADGLVLAQADATNAVINFNGNDTILLRHGAAFLDFFGQYAVDPGIAGWGTDPTNSVDNDLVRKSTVNAGDTNGADTFDPAAEWDGFAIDTFTNLGSHVNGTSSGGGGGSDNVAVAAQVTVPSSAACIQISTNAVDFGTLPLGSSDQPGTPDIGVTNCSGLGSDIYAHGSDASGTGAAWSLIDSTETSADTLGLDHYRLGLEQTGTETGLSTTNKLLESLATGASGTHTARIFTACPGSTGSGTTMSMQITFLATTTGG